MGAVKLACLLLGLFMGNWGAADDVHANTWVQVGSDIGGGAYISVALTPGGTRVAIGSVAS